MAEYKQVANQLESLSNYWISWARELLRSLSNSRPNWEIELIIKKFNMKLDPRCRYIKGFSFKKTIEKSYTLTQLQNKSFQEFCSTIDSHT